MPWAGSPCKPKTVFPAAERKFLTVKAGQGGQMCIRDRVSTVLIVAANLLVGQLIERTRATAGKARPWLLLSVFTFSSASVDVYKRQLLDQPPHRRYGRCFL